MNMHMLSVLSQIGDRSLRILPCDDGRRVHIPEGCKLIIGKKIQEIAQTAGVRERAFRLHKRDDGFVLHPAEEPFGTRPKKLRILRIRMDPDKTDPQINGNCHACLELLHEVRIRKILHRIDARHGQLFRNKLSPHGGSPFRVRRARFPLEEVSPDIIELDALHAGGRGHLQESIPAHIRPVFY